MDSNISELVKSGHEIASDLKASCGAVDVRSVAQLISDLASQLEVQLVRSNTLAAENARLSDIAKGGAFVMQKALMKYEFGVGMTMQAEDFIRDARSKTPATDAFLAEVRAWSSPNEERTCDIRWRRHEVEPGPLYTAPPATVSVPDEANPENIEIIASTFAPRGVTYQWDSDECNAAADSWNACRAAMLQGADQPQNEPQNIPENIPATHFKPVADLYEMQFDDGRTCAFHTDGSKAVQWLLTCDGNKVQEYVKLERYQEALSGNSPVIPDCWCHTCRPVTMADMRFVVCPDCRNKRFPHANDHRNDCTGSNEPGQEGSAYPAAPQQEAE